MRFGIFSSLAALLISAGVAFSQAPASPIVQTAQPFDLPSASPLMPDNPADASFLKDPLDTSRWWVGAEYLLWWFKNSPVPVALATTTSRPDLSPTAALFQEGTSVLLGNQDLDTGARHGVRFTGGVWVDSR